jgi:hypothetical protein
MIVAQVVNNLFTGYSQFCGQPCAKASNCARFGLLLWGEWMEQHTISSTIVNKFIQRIVLFCFTWR